MALLGDLVVNLAVDSRKFTAGLASASTKLKTFGTKVSGAARGLFKFGAAAIGLSVSAVFIGAIKAASDLEETMNKFNVVFGSNSQSMKAWGDTFAGQVGRSKEQIASFLAGTQDLLIPVGLDPAAATKMTKSLTTLAVDVASFNNKADADVLRDFQAALTGGGETVKKYGVILNVAGVKAELLNQGINPKNATEAQKVFARFNILMAGTTAAQGDATRSAGSFANQMKALKAKVSDAATEIGKQLLPTITKMVMTLVDFIPTAAKGFLFLISLFKRFAKPIATAIIVLGGLKIAMIAIVAVQKAMAIGQALVLSLSGPPGWAALAAGAAIAVGAIATISNEYKKFSSSLVANKVAADQSSDSIKSLAKQTPEISANKLPTGISGAESAPATRSLGTPTVIPKSEQIASLKKDLLEISRIDAPPILLSIAKLKEEKIGVLSGVTQQMAELRTELSLLQGFETEIDVTVGKAVAAGALPKQADSLRGLLENIQATRLDKTEGDRLKSVADGIFASTRTESELLNAKLAQLNALRDKGLITDDTFQRAKTQASQGNGKRGGPKFAGALRRGSAAAFSAVNQSRQNPNKKLESLSKQQLDVQKKTADAISSLSGRQQPQLEVVAIG